MELKLTEGLKLRKGYETGRSYLIVEIMDTQKEAVCNYQIEMVLNNPIPLIIPFEIRRIDGDTWLYYDVTSRVLLTDFLKNIVLTKCRLIKLLQGLISGISESRGILLFEESFLFEGDYIYINPESMELSTLYLPLKLKGDKTGSLKNFIIGLITRMARIEVVNGDNYLQRIIEYVKKQEFNIGEFGKLLMDIESEGMAESACDRNKNFFKDTDTRKEDAFSTFPDPMKRRVEWVEADSTAKKKSAARLGEKVEKPKIRTIAVAVVSQVLVISLAVYAETIMSSYGLDESSRYIAIGLFVLASDLLLYKNLILKTKEKEYAESKAPDGDEVSLKRQQPIIETNLHENIRNSIWAEPLMKDAYAAADIGGGSERNSVKTAAVSETLKAGMSLSRLEETTLLYDEISGSAFLVRESRGGMEKFKVKKEGFIIGRHPDVSDMGIEEKAIGRIHAEIVFKNNDYYIIDRNSRNGTYVNDVRLENGSEYKLNNSDRVVFANVEYKFVL